MGFPGISAALNALAGGAESQKIRAVVFDQAPRPRRFTGPRFAVIGSKETDASRRTQLGKGRPLP